jgi:hypothetical protein
MRLMNGKLEKIEQNLWLPVFLFNMNPNIPIGSIISERCPKCNKSEKGLVKNDKYIYFSSSCGYKWSYPIKYQGKGSRVIFTLGKK